MTRPGNLVVVMSDEHSGRHLGVAGHPVVRTPAIDRLAARGRRFTAAHTPSPICVPARASIVTGERVHRTGHRDDARAHDGRMPGWGHRLQAAGIRVESIGKLHDRNADLATDPEETRNRADRPHLSETMRKMRAALDASREAGVSFTGSMGRAGNSRAFRIEAAFFEAAPEFAAAESRIRVDPIGPGKALVSVDVEPAAGEDPVIGASPNVLARDMRTRCA